MGEKRVCGVRMEREADSYIEALYAVLNKANYFNGPKYMLAGMTGIAFKFYSHKKMLAAARYLYHLDTDSWKAVDRLGIYNEIYSGFKNNPTFPLYQKKAIERLKESIDKNMPVILWEPMGTGFAVIDGYDDGDEAFYYKDLHHKDDQIMLYNNVGRVGASFWMFQVIGEHIEKDIRDIYLDSMECCVDEWETNDSIAPFVRSEIGCGGKAYDYSINALNEGCYNESGALTILLHAITSKEQTYRYFNDMKSEFDGINGIVDHYKNVWNIFEKIREIIPKSDRHENKIDRSKIQEITQYLREAKVEEEQAVQNLKLFLKEPLYNRYIDYYDVKKFV